VPRKPYDTSCDLIYGANGASPGGIYASGPCRVVPLRTETTQIQPFASQYAYITMDFAIPTGPNVVNADPVFTYDFSYSDLIAVPNGIPPNFQVLEVQKMAYKSHPVYYRAVVRPNATFPPISGCFGCPLSPSMWRVSWAGAGFADPFNAGSFVLNYVPGSSPTCTYSYTSPGGFNVLLVYPPIGFPDVTSFAPGPALNCQWLLSVPPWNCNSPNVEFQSVANPTYPFNITLSPI
jgi:hypothetical protein